MKTITLLLSALLCTVHAGLPTPEEEIAILKAEYAKREAAATRPVKDWLALELGKKEKAFLAAGKSEAAAAVAKERAIMLICSTHWLWALGATDKYGDRVIVFNMDGTAVRTPLVGGGPVALTWTFHEGNEVALTHPDGRKARIKFDLKAFTFQGDGFAGEGTATKGKAKAQ